jgi:mannose/fructose-specific phosphotransferase system component IIA
MSISEISLYNALRKKLGEQESEELVEFVKAEVKTELESKTSLFLTKEDKVDLIKWMVGLWVSAIGLLIAVLKFT